MTGYKSAIMSHGLGAVQVLDGGRLKLSRKAVQISAGKKEDVVEMPEEGRIYRWLIPLSLRAGCSALPCPCIDMCLCLAEIEHDRLRQPGGTHIMVPGRQQWRLTPTMFTQKIPCIGGLTSTCCSGIWLRQCPLRISHGIDLTMTSTGHVVEAIVPSTSLTALAWQLLAAAMLQGLMQHSPSTCLITGA